jgi:imidazole glycerol-phosphate synthase subunit HisF
MLALAPAPARPRVFRPRVIPVLLLRAGLLYKTRRFREPKYVGDPRVAVKIFNDKGADEIMVFDIDATHAGRGPDFRLIEEIAGECFMPLGYGGGVRSREDVRRLLDLGVEKAVVCTRAAEDPDFIRTIADDNGSQSVVVCMDVGLDLFGRARVVTRGGRTKTKWDPVTFARLMAASGCGEIVVNAVDRDGMMAGYDLALVKAVADAVDVPVIALGGAGAATDLGRAVHEAGASGAAAGSLFVFQGPHRAVLITYPDDRELGAMFGDAASA